MGWEKYSSDLIIALMTNSFDKLPRDHKNIESLSAVVFDQQLKECKKSGGQVAPLYYIPKFLLRCIFTVLDKMTGARYL